MANRLDKRKWFQLFLMGACLVTCLLSVGDIATGQDKLQPVYFSLEQMNPQPTYLSPEKMNLHPVYLSPEQMKEMGMVLTFLPPITPFKVDPSSVPKPKPLTPLPDWVKIKDAPK